MIPIMSNPLGNPMIAATAEVLKATPGVPGRTAFVAEDQSSWIFTGNPGWERVNAAWSPPAPPQPGRWRKAIHWWTPLLGIAMLLLGIGLSHAVNSSTPRQQPVHTVPATTLPDSVDLARQAADITWATKISDTDKLTLCAAWRQEPSEIISAMIPAGLTSAQQFAIRSEFSLLLGRDCP